MGIVPDEAINQFKALMDQGWSLVSLCILFVLISVVLKILPKLTVSHFYFVCFSECDDSWGAIEEDISSMEFTLCICFYFISLLLLIFSSTLVRSLSSVF